MKDPKPASGTLEVPRRMAGKTLEAPKRGGLFGASPARSNLPPTPVRPYERAETRGELDAFQEEAISARSGPDSPAPIDVIIAQAMQPKAHMSERQRRLRAQLDRQRAMQADRRGPEAPTAGPQPRNHRGTPKPPLSASSSPPSARNMSARHAMPQNGDEWLEQLVHRMRDAQKKGASSGTGSKGDGSYALAIAVLIGMPMLILWAFVGSSALFIIGVLLWVGSNKLYAFASGTRESALIARQQLARIHPSWSDPDTARLHSRVLAGMCVVACVILQWDVIFG